MTAVELRRPRRRRRAAHRRHARERAAVAVRRARLGGARDDAARARDRARPRPARRDRERPARARARASSVPADRTIVLPPIQGPWIDGLPARRPRLHPGRPRTAASAGCTASSPPATPPRFPIKQGGLATQQADVVADDARRRPRRRRLGRAVPAGAARPAAHRRRAAVPPRGADRRRGRARTGHAPARAARRGLDPRALVAARQGRRPLPRAVPGDGPARSRSAASRYATAVAGRPRGAGRRPPTTRSSSHC